MPEGGSRVSGFGCPLCWYYYGRCFRAIASVPYEEWIRKIGREMKIGEVIALGGLLIKRAGDGEVEIAVEGDES